MRIKVILLFFVVLILSPGLLKSEDEIPVRIAILPLEVFSLENKSDLGQEVSMKLSKKLSINPYILICDFKDVQAVQNEDENKSMDEQRLNEIARLLNANFVLFGSITIIKDEVSIDAQVFNNFSSERFFKTYAEGKATENLIEKIANNVEQDILKKAASMPDSMRPQLKSNLQEERKDNAGYGKDIGREVGTAEDVEQKQNKESERIGAQSKVVEKPLEDERFIIYASPQQKEAVIKQKGGQFKKKKETGKTNADQKPFQSDSPIKINADSMEYNNKKNEANFTGNVVARQENIVMYSDKMKVLYSEQGGLKQIFALGNVKIIQGEKIATGQKIVYYNDLQKIIATGNPRVWQGDNIIQGNKITVFLKEDRTVVDGGSEERASATIYPKDKKLKKD
jgi:lipopolysaccharide export system protein LptA